MFTKIVHNYSLDPVTMPDNFINALNLEMVEEATLDGIHKEVSEIEEVLLSLMIGVSPEDNYE